MKKKKYEKPSVKKVEFQGHEPVMAYNCAAPNFLNDGSCHG